MCNPAAIPYVISAAVAVAGAKMQADAQNDAADRQQRAINDSLEQQDQYSQKAEAKALENAGEYEAKTRLARFDEARTAAGNSLAQQLTESRESAPQMSQPAGRMSQEFLTGDAKAKADQFEKSIEMAQLMGKVRGANDMLTNEGYTNADYASQLGIIGRNAQGAGQAAQAGISSAGKVDSGQMMLGGLAQSLGTSYLGSGLGKGMLSASTGADVGNGVGNANLMNSGSSNLFDMGGGSGIRFGATSGLRLG